MKKNIIFWSLAVVFTIVTAYYQRITGPTYPIKNKILIENKTINYSLLRSYVENNNMPISIETSKEITGKVKWRRFKTNDEIQTIEMVRKGNELYAELPHQPPAGKLEYKVVLELNGKDYPLNNNEKVVIRFKGDVPSWILIPHIITIFFAMLMSNRTILEIFNPTPKLKQYTFWTIISLLVGGLFFGPLTQYYAFGALWTGFPFGHDLTDNKTLIAFIGWLVAYYFVRKNKNPKRWVAIAAIVLIITYLIPHSLLGSELDYSKLDAEKNKIEKLNE